MNEILITGGSGKVGFQLVSYFLSLNYRVITTTRNQNILFQKIQSKISNIQIQNLKIIEVDFTNEDAVQTIISYLGKENLNPQATIHNARSLEFLKIEDDSTITNQNFLSELFLDVVFPYRLTMEILNKTNKLENVLFISSIYGVVAPTPSLYENFQQSSPINYGVSKAAQIHLTKELAVRLAPKIRVNCVSFGGIKGRVDESFLKRYKSLNPQGKMMDENEVIGPVDFLVSENSKNMTGQNIIIDGGWTIW